MSKFFSYQRIVFICAIAGVVAAGLLPAKNIFAARHHNILLNQPVAFNATAGGEGGWKYWSDTDQATASIRYNARIDAQDNLLLKSPNGGVSLPELFVGNMLEHNIVVLTISKGEFVIPGIDEGTGTIMAKFDDENPEPYKVDASPAHTHSSFSINANSLFLWKLTQARRVYIQAEVKDNGNQIIEFDVAGFVWKH